MPQCHSQGMGTAVTAPSTESNIAWAVPAKCRARHYCLQGIGPHQLHTEPSPICCKQCCQAQPCPLRAALGTAQAMLLSGDGAVPAVPILIPCEQQRGILLGTWHRLQGTGLGSSLVLLSGDGDLVGQSLILRVKK